jgi:hypothetical protein
MYGDDFGAGLGTPRADFQAAPPRPFGGPGAVPSNRLSAALQWMLGNPGYYPYLPDDLQSESSAPPPANEQAEPNVAPAPSGRYLRPVPPHPMERSVASPPMPASPDADSVDPATFGDVDGGDFGRLPDGYHLAQSTGNARRPFAIIGPTGRDLTIPQWMLWQNWNSGIYRLREIDPKNPMLQNLYGPNWVPDSERDIAPLYREINRARGEQGRRELELHHAFPNQFATQFRANGISDAFRDGTTYFIWRDQHRGRGGLHPYWNRDWQKFLETYQKEGPGPIFENMQDMLEKYDQWYGS